MTPMDKMELLRSEATKLVKKSWGRKASCTDVRKCHSVHGTTVYEVVLEGWEAAEETFPEINTAMEQLATELGIGAVEVVWM